MNRGLNTAPETMSNDPPEENSVTAVVINRNGGAALFECLASLEAQREVSIAILVLDNGSWEGERRQIADRHPNARLVTFSENLGFARAANEALARTTGELVLFVNNDARLANDYVARLSGRLCLDRRLAGVQGLVLNSEGSRVDSAGIVWNRRGEAVPLFQGAPANDVPTAVREVPGVSATAVLFRRTALGEVAEPDGRVFDESFFAYYEDADLSLRLSRAGYRFVCDPEAIAFHVGSMTGRRTPWRRSLWLARNRWRTLLKNFEPTFLRAQLPTLLAADLAHARRAGLAGPMILAAVWPGALVRTLSARARGLLLERFPN